MAKNLLIVESPAKAKTIEGYLGKDFLVKSSYGHIRDLVKGDMAIDTANNFAQTYEVPSDKKQVVAELKKLAKDAEMVWLASDEDREGEAISWHLYETLGLKENKTKRIVFYAFDCFFCLFFNRHFHKTKTTTLTSLTIFDYPKWFYLTEITKYGC